MNSYLKKLEENNKSLHKRLWELEDTREAIRTRMVEIYCIRERFDIKSLTATGRSIILGEDNNYNIKEILFLVPKALIGQIDDSH